MPYCVDLSCWSFSWDAAAAWVFVFIMLIVVVRVEGIWWVYNEDDAVVAVVVAADEDDEDDEEDIFISLSLFSNISNQFVSFMIVSYNFTLFLIISKCLKIKWNAPIYI